MKKIIKFLSEIVISSILTGMMPVMVSATDELPSKWDNSTNENAVYATEYDVCIKVRDSTGTIEKKYFDLKVNAKLKNTSEISETTINKGDIVIVKGSAKGGIGEYAYAVLYKKKSETKWTVRQNYNSNNEILVRPYTNTDYDICIKVKDKTGIIVKKYFDVSVK